MTTTPQRVNELSVDEGLTVDEQDFSASEVISPAESVRGQHVLIVGINYAPEPTGIAPYTAQMAEHLARSAASVTVLTGLPSYPAWKVADGYGGFRSRSRVNGVNIIRLAHHVPRRQTALRRGLYELSFMAHAASVRIRQSPDLVLAVTPALGGALAAAQIARRHKARLVVVVQDLMSKAVWQSGISGGSSLAGVAARAEASALRKADRVAVVADAFRPVVESLGVEASKVSLLRNWSHVGEAQTDLAAMRQGLGWGKALTVVLHTGNMGLKQDLGNVIEAARLTQDNSSLLWVLMGDGSQRRALEAQAAGLRNLKFLAPCGADVYPDVLAAADLLLLNERSTVGDMSLPSKLTSYFLSGRPVVGAVADGGATSLELQRSGGAVAVGSEDPAALAAEVTMLATRSEDRLRLGVSGRHYAMSSLTARQAMECLDVLLATACSKR